MSEKREPLQLSVVMPVHNEAHAIGTVLSEWTEVLDGIGMSYELLVYDDGSSDGTAAALNAVGPSMPHVTVRRHGNRGHGPTILRGYREARGEWMFQTDSDGEIAANEFHSLWKARAAADMILGVRRGRIVSPVRRAVSRLAASHVLMLFGCRVQDANTPFRLMRRAAFEPVLRDLPDDCFAPNVILCGLAGRAGLRICEIPVLHRGRTVGRSSLRPVRLVRAVSRSSWQAVAVALRSGRRSAP
jgi:dolichol-phosphate mannosyltransferase